MSIEIEEYRGIRAYDELPPEVVSGLETCIASAFGGGITQDDARHHISGDQVLVASAKIDGTYVVKGFSSTSITSPTEEFNDPTLSDQKGAYFAGAAICSTVQGSGLYHSLNSRRFDYALEHRVDNVFTRTQNPRVQEGITASIERLVEKGVIRGYMLETTLRRGAYGRMLTSLKPAGRFVQYNELDYERGDAMVLSWQFD